ncbi:hypothetical protein [Streptomyces sp. NPDC051286]|uniref:hypothetical protein n=1 Tax=Streptomyces sp. NPDC051286 TaxID=3365647 RepID=UPI00378825F3
MVRQSGGRLDPEHRTGRAPVQVLISRVGCVICGSGRIPVAGSGAECEAYYRRRRARSPRRTWLRRDAASQPAGRLIADRAQAADRMRTLYRKWEAKGPDPLPGAISLLEPLRAALDSVAALETKLARRSRRNPATPGRRSPAGGGCLPPQLLPTLMAGKRTVHHVLVP